MKNQNQNLPTQDKPVRRNPERGAAMVVVIALLIGLLAGGVTVLWLQIQSTRATGLVHNDRNALFCAEAGIPHGIQWFTDNPGVWESNLLTGPALCGPPGPTTNCKKVVLSLDIDPVGHPHDGINDFEITLWDNDDELDGQNLPDSDRDQRVIMRSTCIKYPEAPRYVAHLVQNDSLPPTVGCTYKNTGGQGCGNTNNMN